MEDYENKSISLLMDAKLEEFMKFDQKNNVLELNPK